MEVTSGGAAGGFADERRAIFGFVNLVCGGWWFGKAGGMVLSVSRNEDDVLPALPPLTALSGSIILKLSTRFHGCFFLHFFSLSPYHD